jgi:tetratricopeptide (TPR) repeat protein
MKEKAVPDLRRELVFLSYANEDLRKVWDVYKGLTERGLKVWFDKKDLEIGRWKSQIMKAISRSRYFVICLSMAALRKTGDETPGFQDEELQRAYEIALNQPDDKFSIVPVRLEDCDRGDHRISTFQQYDLFEDWEKELDKLAVHLGGDSLSDATARDERTEDEKMLSGMMGKGATFYYSGEYDSALSILEAVINIEPGYHLIHEAWNSKGNTLAALGRPEEAIEAYEKAIQIKEGYHEAWYNKGGILGNLGRHDEALKAAEKAIEIKPDYYRAWINKGGALANLGRYKDALKAFEKAIEIKGDFHEGCYNLACVYSLKKEKGKALKYLRKAIEYGYNDLSHIKKDKDFDFIRDEKEFQKIISDLTQMEDKK